MKLDILVFAAHPDDAELGCSGTILKHVKLGKKVGIVDLTRGELGTRGTADLRDEEAAESAGILGLAVRENLGMRDAYFLNDEEHRLQIIKKIREYQPEIILCNARFDRHPDHGRSGDLVNDAVFLSALPKIVTDVEGVNQKAWKPKILLQFIQDYYIKPDIVIDVTNFWDQKVRSIQAFKSQFYNPEYDKEEQQTYISSPDFLKVVEARAREYGKYIDAVYGEGFTCRRLLGVDSLFDLR